MISVTDLRQSRMNFEHAQAAERASTAERLAESKAIQVRDEVRRRQQHEGEAGISSPASPAPHAPTAEGRSTGDRPVGTQRCKVALRTYTASGTETCDPRGSPLWPKCLISPAGCRETLG
jgi:hypothetical protein